jgi:hypothetical protein
MTGTVARAASTIETMRFISPLLDDVAVSALSSALLYAGACRQAMPDLDPNGVSDGENVNGVVHD